MNSGISLDRDRLHAYVDGRLAEEDAADVRAALAADPDASDDVAAWSRQNAALKAIFGPIAEEPVPPRLNVRALALRDHLPSAGARFQPLAAALVLAVGLAGGWIARDLLIPVPSLQSAGLAREALLAHAVFTPEVRHPVEVGADEAKHLGGWLSKRLSHSLTLPDLTGEGFTLVGGRLVTADTGPAALIMYENVAGERITIFAARNINSETTAFHWEQQAAAGTFIWLDGPVGYAISGDLPRERLLGIAHSAYAQLSPAESRS